MIKVLVVDDHPIVREGLKQVIEKGSDMKVTGEAFTGQEALDKVYAGGYDVVVLDFSLPGKSGLDVIKELRRERPKTPILVLSMHPEGELGPRLLKAGAAGYLTKESAPKELVHAIRRVHDGGKYVSAALAEKLAADLSVPSEEKAHEVLSDREYQVLVMIAMGKTIQEIASEFSLSVKTVRTYRERILRKMNLKNDVEITHFAIENHLIIK